MWDSVIESVVVGAVVIGALRFVARQMGIWGKPAEPEDPAGVPAKLKPRPRPRQTHVALDEPEEEEEESA